MGFIDPYHGSYDRDSNSSLKLFSDSIERYAAIRVHRTMAPPEPTPAMVFGSAFDCYLLEPGEFASRYAVLPECDGRTKGGKEILAAFRLEADGKTCITLDDMNRVKAMAEAVRRHDWADAALQAAGECQKVFTWEDEQTGLPLKMKADKVCGSGLIIDVKTAASMKPEDLARAVASYGYHRQASLYLTGAWRAAQVEGPFIFLAVCKEPPHEVVIFSLDDNALAIGFDQNQKVIHELTERKNTNNWTGRWSGDIQTISLPRWATY